MQPFDVRARCLSLPVVRLCGDGVKKSLCWFLEELPPPQMIEHPPPAPPDRALSKKEMRKHKRDISRSSLGSIRLTVQELTFDAEKHINLEPFHSHLLALTGRY
jgi:hypothetical protein